MPHSAMNAKVAPKNLPCLFESLTNEYDESQLTRCETKEGQKWRRATANAAAKRITEMVLILSISRNCLHYLTR